MAKTDHEMPRPFVRTQRMLWAAMVLGQVAFTGVVAYRVTTAGAAVSPAAVPPVAPAIGVGVLIVGVAAAVACRLAGFTGIDGSLTTLPSAGGTRSSRSCRWQFSRRPRSSASS